MTMLGEKLRPTTQCGNRQTTEDKTCVINKCYETLLLSIVSGLAPEEIAEIMRLHNLSSLDKPLGRWKLKENRTITLGEIIPGKKSLEEEVIKIKEKREMWKAFSDLDPEEQRVLNLRGYTGHQERRSFRKIGEICGKTKGQIMRIDARAKEKLRKNPDLEEIYNES